MAMRAVYRPAHTTAARPVVDQRHYQTEVKLSDLSELNRKMTFDKALAKYPNLKRITATSDDRLNDEELKRLAGYLKKAHHFHEFVYVRNLGKKQPLRRDTVVDWGNFSYLTLEGILNAFKDLPLEHLEIHNLTRFETQDNLEHPTLRTLIAQSDNFEDVYFILAHLRKFPKLETLKLKQITLDAINREIFTQGVERPLANLKTLELEGVFVGCEGLKHLSALETLEVRDVESLPLRQLFAKLDQAPLPALKILRIGINEASFDFHDFFKKPRPGLIVHISFPANAQYVQNLTFQIQEINKAYGADIRLQLLHQPGFNPNELKV